MQNLTSFFSIPFNLDFTVDTALLFISSVLMILTCFRLATSRNLLSSVILMSAFSLLIGLCYLFLDAPDVAMTETALGACLSSCVLLNVIKITGEATGETKRLRTLFASLICLLFTAILAWAATDLPEFGKADSPIQEHVTKYYIENTRHEIGIPSMVAAILASYRGFDTLGETTVILVAGLGVVLVLNRRKTEKPTTEALEITKENTDRNTDRTKLEDFIILKTVGPIYIPYIFLYALYIQMNGEASPGGGFQAGVIFASGLIVYDLIYGIKALKLHISKRILLLGGVFGVMIYAGVGVATLIMGGNFLDYSMLLEPGSHAAENSALLAQSANLGSASMNTPNPSGQHLGIFIIELGVGITVTSIMCLIYIVIRPSK